MRYNRTVRLSGYSPYFLLFGTTPPTQRDSSSSSSTVANYAREASDKEEVAFDKELVAQHEAPLARLRANGIAATQAQTRAYL